MINAARQVYCTVIWLFVTPDAANGSSERNVSNRQHVLALLRRLLGEAGIIALLPSVCPTPVLATILSVT